MDEQSILFMDSYLSGRQQQVEIESFLSAPLQHPPSSIIQGSIGSSILFSIFIADLPLALHPHLPIPAEEKDDCDGAKATTFVDDNSMVVTDNNPKATEEKAQVAIDKMEEYMTNSKLQINKKKTKIITITKPTNNDKVTITAGNEIVTSKDSMLLFGFHLDQDLGWKTTTRILRHFLY